MVFLFDQLYEAHRKHIKTKTEEWNQASRNDEQFIAVRLNLDFVLDPLHPHIRCPCSIEHCCEYNEHKDAFRHEKV